MKKLKSISLSINLSVAGLLLLAACSSQPNATSPQPDATEPVATNTETPEFTDVALVNATTGEQFTLADFQDKTISIEAMSVTCSKCQEQHKKDCPSISTVEGFR
ncbi:MAG: hypothetical protein HC925_00110 [Coleofasciculaceae cyanobacterium SM2_3_26]|nr:hypothetical protein [Coleofasciculaceae cyanobacterium SM2_3_26]